MDNFHDIRSIFIHVERNGYICADETMVFATNGTLPPLRINVQQS